MDENTPPVTANHNQDAKKLLGGSPNVRNVLSPSNRNNVQQSSDIENLKKNKLQSPAVTVSPVCNKSALCREVIPADSDDDEILFQPRCSKVEENTESIKSEKQSLQTPVKSLSSDSTVIGLSPSQFKDVENIFEIDEDDSVLSSMTKRLDSPCKSSAGQGSINEEKPSKQSDNIEDACPFKSKNEIPNSPASTAEASKSLKETVESDPFATKSKVMNSPVSNPAVSNFKDEAIDDLVATEGDKMADIGDGLPDCLEDADPFGLKTDVKVDAWPDELINSSAGNITVIENLPENLSGLDYIEAVPTTDSSADKPSSTDSQQIASHAVNLPDNLDDVDPFKPKKQIVNSPAKPAEKQETQDALPDNLDDVDPFKPKKQIVNSPAKPAEKQETQDECLPDVLPDNLDDVDPFKPKKQMVNSPIKTSDLQKTQEKQENSQDILPDNSDDVDPFKPKTQIVNSPTKPATLGNSSEVNLPDNLDDIDPFKPKKQIVNSPTKPAQSQKVQEEILPDTLPDNLDDVDPFKPKTQIVNSPTKPATSEILSEETLPENLDDIDPFKPNKQMCNSPAKMQTLPDNLDDIDPFKPKAQIVNSPVKPSEKQISENKGSADDLDDLDPFKQMIHVCNTPSKPAEQNLQPSQTETLPDNLDEIDPFKPKKQVQNSPVKPADAQQKSSKENLADNFDDIDPFKPKIQVQNSPIKKAETENKKPGKENVEKTESSAGDKQVFVDPFDNLDAFNPFQGMGKANITPSKNNASDLLMGFGNTPKSGAGIDLGNNLMCMIAPEKKVDEDSMNLADSEFRPANEVFSDPSVWDMLEKFGSSNSKEESELARMSLYVKFDPLVDSNSSSSPGGKQQAASGRCLQRMEVVRDGDESIMLMGTPPKPGGRRRSILVQRRPATSVATTIFEEDTEQKPSKPHIVDLMLCCQSPDSKAPQEQKEIEQNGDDFSEVVEVLKYSETDVKKMLEKQRKEMTMEFQGRTLAMEQKYTTELKEMSEIKSGNKEMMKVVSEYEKLINELISERENQVKESKEEISKLKAERDQAQNDLNAIENCFSELLKRFEKAKGMLAGFKTNEEALKASYQEQVAKLKKKDETIAKLKSQAEAKLKQILEAKEKEKTGSSAEILKLESALKRSELKVGGLEKELEQKRKENAELTDLCDALIAKVGGS